MRLTERTAITEYTLAGQPVRAGQVAALTPLQIRTLAAAGCVALTDEENALVPTSGLPPLQDVPGRQEVDGYATAVATARRQAEADISAINRSVEEARAKATEEATALEQGLENRRRAAADEIAQIEARVQAARAVEVPSAGATGATGAGATGSTGATGSDTGGAAVAKKAR